MYLREFQIQGIKCFEDVTLDFPHSNNDYSGWIVLLGGNGMGKSTLLQAMTIAMVGPLAGQRLLLNPEMRGSAAPGPMASSRPRSFAGLMYAWRGQPRKTPYQTRFLVIGRQEVTIENVVYDQPQLVHQGDPTAKKGLMSGPYAAKRSGLVLFGLWSLSQAPRRLFRGVEVDVLAGPRVEVRHTFREAAALTHCTEWLCSLYSRSIDTYQPDESEPSRPGNIEGHYR